jgi:hypothetical protein
MRIDEHMTPAEAARWWKREAEKESNRKHDDPEYGLVDGCNCRMIVSDPVHHRPTKQKEWYKTGYLIRRVQL